MIYCTVLRILMANLSESPAQAGLYKNQNGENLTFMRHVAQTQKWF